jgi:inositol phosphorylceramide synthase regulatory subunit
MLDLGLTGLQKFLHFMSLRTGTSLILLTHFINKVTAVYGILAIFTSFPLSPVQLSMYIYSVPVLLLTIYLAGPIRTQSPWHCLAFSYLYVLDSIVNAVYTAVFAVAWYMVLATDGGGSKKVPGGAMMDHASGFTDPVHNVSQVEIVAKPKDGIAPAQEAIAVGTGSAASASLASAVLNSSSMMSIFIIVTLWVLRMYAIAVVMAYARQVLRHHIQVSSLSNFDLYSGSKRDDLADDPFSESKPQGEGLKGRIGRLMVKIGRNYWLGRDDGNDIMLKPYPPKYRKSEDGQGVLERERRRRSGTGPPAPSAA